MINSENITDAILNLRPQDRFDNPKKLNFFTGADVFYCSFKINAPEYSGVYRFLVNSSVMYIGRAKSLKGRLSRQYGTVSPRHPFKGGQGQKCRINALINNALVDGSIVTAQWEVCENYIERERELLTAPSKKPTWNIKL